jgi:hypothetical protein
MLWEVHAMDFRQVYETYVRPLALADRLRLAERIVAEAAEEATPTEGAAAPAPVAPEPLGARLRAIRSRIEQAGEPLLDEAALRRELAERRGGAEAWEQEHAHVR